MPPYNMNIKLNGVTGPSSGIKLLIKSPDPQIKPTITKAKDNNCISLKPKVKVCL
jgi:hypothetical protein